MRPACRSSTCWARAGTQSTEATASMLVRACDPIPIRSALRDAMGERIAPLLWTWAPFGAAPAVRASEPRPTSETLEARNIAGYSIRMWLTGRGAVARKSLHYVYVPLPRDD